MGADLNVADARVERILELRGRVHRGDAGRGITVDTEGRRNRGVGRGGWRVSDLRRSRCCDGLHHIFQLVVAASAHEVGHNDGVGKAAPPLM